MVALVALLGVLMTLGMMAAARRSEVLYREEWKAVGAASGAAAIVAVAQADKSVLGAIGFLVLVGVAFLLMYTVPAAAGAPVARGAAGIEDWFRNRPIVASLTMIPAVAAMSAAAVTLP